MTETYLTELYKENLSSDKVLNAEEIEKEIQFLIGQKKIDALLTLYILEYLSKIKVDTKFIDVAFKMFKDSRKHLIYNLRILKLIVDGTDLYVPIADKILKIFNKIDVKNENNAHVDWNSIKVGNDVSESAKYTEFVLKKGISILIKSINTISNSLGFPEIADLICGKLKNFKLEGKPKIYIQEAIKTIEQQKQRVIEVRNKVKLVKYERNEISKIESNISKIKEQLI